MRTFVIGDIHGGYKAFQQVLLKAKFNFDKDTLICLGDVVDGWSETNLVIERLREIKNLILIRGNHDDWLLFNYEYARIYLENDGNIDSKTFDRLDKLKYFNLWYNQGGKETLQAYKGDIELFDEHIKFLKKKSLEYYLDDDENLFVHGGFWPNFELDSQPNVNDVPSSDEKNSEFWWNRDLITDLIRDYYNYIGKPSEEYLENLSKFKNIYVGHTPTSSIYNFSLRAISDEALSMKEELNPEFPIKFRNVIALDTAATYQGKLSMINLETEELFQSDYVYQLYPNERGRNDLSYNEIQEYKKQNQ